MNIIEATTHYDHAMCIYIRTEVFIHGQDCPVLEEFDSRENEEQAINFIGYQDNGGPAVTARYRIVDDNVGKIERVAVMEEYQGQGLGKKVISHVMDVLNANSAIETIKLGAQDQAIGFYEKLGFKAYGDGYMEAGIPHHMMKYSK